MKKLFFLISINVCFSCKAQVFDIYDLDTDYGALNGAYYKDVNGFTDQFIGTWAYTSGNTSFTITLKKKTELTCNDGISNFRQDMIVGEYKYVVNGQEIINTLPNINDNFGFNYVINRDRHNITGWMDWPPNLNPKCSECAGNEKRLRLTLGEPGYDGMGIASNSFVVRHFVENGIEKLKVWFVNENQMYIVDDAGNAISPAPYKLPFGEYVLVKQN